MVWPFKRKVRQRRLQVRRHLPIRQAGWWQAFRRAGGIGSSLIGLALLLALVGLDAITGPEPPYRPGQYVPADIHARVDFLSKKSPDQARKFTPAVFALKPQRLQRVQQQLEQLPGRLQQDGDQTRQALAEQMSAEPAEVETFARRLSNIDAEAFAADIAALDEALAEIALVSEQQAAVQRTRAAKEVLLSGPERTERIPIQELVVLQDPHLSRRHVRGKLNQKGLFDRRIRPRLADWIVSRLSEIGPLWEYDAEATNQRIDQSVEAVKSFPPEQLPEYLRVQHLAGEPLVRASRRGPGADSMGSGMSRAEIELLRDERQAYRALEQTVAPWRNVTRLAGRAGILAVILGLLGAYLAFYYPRVIENQWRALSLALVLLIGLGAAQLAVYVLEWNVYAAVFSVLLASIIAALVYDRRFALMFAAVATALQVVLLSQGVQVGMVFFVTAAVTILQLNDVRTRTKLIRVAAVGAGAMAATIWLLQLAQDVPWPFILANSLWGAAAAVFVGFLTQGILPLIERVFRIATSMTLLEWCDASKPLLKRVAMEAPGTYNHSLQLGAMCEAAAEAISADGLRARVGAYYHDIGKIHKPPYFIENQSGSSSKHAKLSPAMSLLIIIGHVKDGLELAREYNLPRVLHEFISTHHGTTLVQYFYRAATEQRKNGSSDRAPDETEFRYPGPKPRSREAAILMLADASESSVRSMNDPTPGRIENQVHTMVTRRMMDGQLDECFLTLREVHQIESSLVKSLCSFYHSRIAYPTPQGQKPSAAEMHPKADKPKPAQDQDQASEDQDQAEASDRDQAAQPARS
jgi:putative nucleotidyltransferase with HDIG domain